MAKTKLTLVSRNVILDEQSLMAIPVAHYQEYSFRSEKALLAKRAFLYGVNKNNAAGRKWRTFRTYPGSLTLHVIRLS